MAQRMFSGIQPTGYIHIGNYLAAIRQWVQAQRDNECFFCIVDLHAITVPQNPAELRTRIRELTGLLIACGIDPEKSVLFVQSQVGAHAELAWILNCFIPMGWMRRMTQFKEKSARQKEEVTVGLFDYPALMAADILLYDADIVPVGDDQTQHVELTQDVAERFNSIYGETFKIPRAFVPAVGARIMGLDDPTKKMSKSEARQDHAVGLLDSPDQIRRKIARATTDSSRDIVFDEKRPGIYNLLVLYELFSAMRRPDIEAKFQGKGYSDFKKELAELVVEKLSPLQERYGEITGDQQHIIDLLNEGAARARLIAESTLTRVKEKIGLG